MAEFDFHIMIESFLRNELQGEELEAFKEEMRTNPEFTFEVGVQRDIMNSYNPVGFADFQQSIDTIREEIDQNGSSGSNRWIYFAGLFVLILATLFWFLAPEKNNSDCSFENLYQVCTQAEMLPVNLYGLPETRLSARPPGEPEAPLSQRTQDSLMLAADSLYRNRSYDKSLEIIKSLFLSEYPKQDQLFLNAGILSLLVGDATASLSSLGSINLQDLKEREGRWFKGVALLKLEQRQEALEQFSAMSGGKEIWLETIPRITDCLTSDD